VFALYDYRGFDAICMTDMLSSLTISQGLRKLQNRSQSTVRHDIQFIATDNQS